MRAKNLFNEESTRQIEQAIADVESNTSAEIVCAVATESGRYDRAEGIVGLIVGLIALGLADLVHHWITTDPGDWSIHALAFGWQAAAVVAGFVGGTVLATYCHGLRRLFVGDREIEAEVQQAAWHVFASAAVRGTIQNTGLLIYVSLFERRVVILADEHARKALGDEKIDELRDSAVAHLGRGRYAPCYVETIRSAGEVLAEKLPADREMNPNELEDHVLVFHPRP